MTSPKLVTRDEEVSGSNLMHHHEIRALFYRAVQIRGILRQNNYNELWRLSWAVLPDDIHPQTFQLLPSVVRTFDEARRESK